MENLSWNCGVEGETDDPDVMSLRARQERNFIATLLLSQGTPSFQHGDEIGHTKRGNNNTYCQDNELNWLEWELDSNRGRLFSFTREVIRLRKDHPVFRRWDFYRKPQPGEESRDMEWLRPDGKEMAEADWADAAARCLGVLLSGKNLREANDRGLPIEDESFLILFNTSSEPVRFTLSSLRTEGSWQLVMDTRRSAVKLSPQELSAGAPYELESHSMALFRFLENEKEED